MNRLPIIKDFILAIDSPCIRNCCLNEYDICLGCFRHIDEIVGWQQRTESEKLQVMTNIEQRKKQHNREP